MIDADDGGFCDIGMNLESLLDLDWVDVLSSAKDEVVAAGGQVKTSVQHPAHVAGAQPSSGKEDLRRRRRVAPIFEHHERTADVDLAFLAVRERLTVLAAD